MVKNQECESYLQDIQTKIREFSKQVFHFDVFLENLISERTQWTQDIEFETYEVEKKSALEELKHSDIHKKHIDLYIKYSHLSSEKYNLEESLDKMFKNKVAYADKLENLNDLKKKVRDYEIKIPQKIEEIKVITKYNDNLLKVINKLMEDINQQYVPMEVDFDQRLTNDEKVPMYDSDGA